MQKTNTFESQQNKKMYKIFQCQLSQQLRYIFDGAHFSNKYYVEKAEISFNIRLDNHRKDVK